MPVYSLKLEKLYYKNIVRIVLLSLFLFMVSNNLMTNTSYLAMATPYESPYENYDDHDDAAGGFIVLFTVILVLVGYPIFFITSYYMLKNTDRCSPKELYKNCSRISWKKVKELALIMFFMGSIILVLEMFLISFLMDYVTVLKDIGTRYAVLFGSYIILYLFGLFAGIQSIYIDTH